MKKEDIKSFVLSNPDLVTMKKQPNGFYVLKYKNKVFYNNLWTPELLECRGTVVDSDFNIISRPFTKIFNYGENGTCIHSDSIVTAVEKVNGFMAAVTYHNGENIVSTTGSCNSKYVDYAKELLSQDAYELSSYYPFQTMIYEIVHKEDPHIIKEETGVYLLGARNNTWESGQHVLNEDDLDDLALQFSSIKRPNWYRMKFKDLRNIASSVKHEGFVCWDDNKELKIKSPYYLTTKFFARMKETKFNYIVNQVVNSSEINSKNIQLLQYIDEEYYPLVQYLCDNHEIFQSLGEQDRIKYIEDYYNV